MKTAILYLLLTCSSIMFGQAEKTNNDEIAATGLSISTDDLDELKTMDWDKMLSLFKGHANAEDEVAVTIKYVIESKKKRGVKVERAITKKVYGTAGNLEKLKADLKEETAGIVAAVEKM